MEIITTPDPRLRQKAYKINPLSSEVAEIVDKMVTASLAWEQQHPHEISAAMAAPQMGIDKRIVIIRDDNNDKSNTTFTALINPEIIKTSGELVEDYEGCLSVPFIYGLVKRPTKIKLKAFLPSGQEIRLKLEGMLARTLLHELDHLDGILFIDHIRGQHDKFFKMRDDGELEPVDGATICADPNYFPDPE